MKLLVVDDHPIVRDGLVALLGRLGPDTVVLQVGDAARALAMAVEHADPRHRHPRHRHAGHGWSARAQRVRSRAAGTAGDRDLGLGGRAGCQGGARERGARLRAEISEPAHASLRRQAGPRRRSLCPAAHPRRGPAQPRARSRAAATPAGSALTRRQIDVLKQLSQGKSNKSIALELGLSEKTVKAHVTAIFKALNVINRTQAAAAGREAGLI